MGRFFPSSDEQLKRACQELNIPVSRFQDDVERIKTWMQTQPHLPDPCEEDGLLYENMLLRCKGSVEVAKQALDFYCSQRAAVPEFFADRDPCGPSLTTFIRSLTTTVLKDLTSEGYRVTIFQLLGDEEKLSDFTGEDMIKWWLLDTDIRLYEDVSLGEVYVHDLQHLRMKHIVQVTVPLLQKGFVCGINGYKARIKGIHVLNSPPYAEVLLNIFRSVLSKKLKSRMHVHSNMESFHRFVDREICPKNYGGDKGTLNDLADAWVKEVQSCRDWILEKDARCIVDESKRPGKSFNISDIFGIEGTFKQLSVD